MGFALLAASRTSLWTPPEGRLVGDPWGNGAHTKVTRTRRYQRQPIGSIDLKENEVEMSSFTEDTWFQRNKQKVVLAIALLVLVILAGLAIYFDATTTMQLT